MIYYGDAGVQNVLIIGSDCPDIIPEHLEQSLAALDKVDVVTGPATDGG